MARTASTRAAWAVPALLLAACATPTVGPPTGETDAPRNRDVIAEAEIRELPVTNTYELVSRLRPEWIRSRGPASMRGGGAEYPVVYLDGIRSGSIEALQRISTLQISEVRFISARDAATRFGLNHGGGAIMVSSQRGSRGGGGGSPGAALDRG